MLVCFLIRDRKGMDPDGRGGVGDLEGVQGEGKHNKYMEKRSVFKKPSINKRS